MFLFDSFTFQLTAPCRPIIYLQAPARAVTRVYGSALSFIPSSTGDALIDAFRLRLIVEDPLLRLIAKADHCIDFGFPLRNLAS
jgi:hypothetical protein